MNPSHAAPLLLVLSRFFERSLKSGGFLSSGAPPAAQCECRCEVLVAAADEKKDISAGTQLFKDFFGVALGACLAIVSQAVLQRNGNGRRATTALEVAEGSPRHGLSPRSSLSASSESLGEIRQQA